MSENLQHSATPHEQAISIIENHIWENIGGQLSATADCNQCSEQITINLVEGAAAVNRNSIIGSVRPDLTILDSDGNAIRFVEIVDSHAPESNVHRYALNNNIEVLEFHLKARGEFTGRRRNRALDESLRVKARLEALTDQRLEVDAHNLLCRRPKCKDCGTPLPLRTITISTKDCWSCGQNVNVAVGHKDGHGLEQDDFTKEEIEFAEDHAVTLERRFSSTVGAKYLANVCTNCDQIQGNWFLYMDPYHDRFNLHRTEREAYGPCDRCAMRYCPTHGEYFAYYGTRQCPRCLEESERVMCHSRPNRQCYYPNRCQEGGCYFVNREAQRATELATAEAQAREREERWRNADREERRAMLAEWRDD